MQKREGREPENLLADAVYLGLAFTIKGEVDEKNVALMPYTLALSSRCTYHHADGVAVPRVNFGQVPIGCYTSVIILFN